jgi:hypothetical protein
VGTARIMAMSAASAVEDLRCVFILASLIVDHDYG